MTDEKLLEVVSLKKYFRLNAQKRSSTVLAVDDVSFFINRGETFGLVGESGCGKSTLGKTILRLIEPTSGSIIYAGEDTTTADMRKYRRKMQIIFQDPAGSLDPHMRVRNIICEAMVINKIGDSKQQRLDMMFELLEKVGLNPEHAERYPHEFSGGQQQRIGIARALAVKPEFIVCDEPISALDVSIQSQIINLLKDMQQELGLTYLFIAHELSVVRHISDRVGVMYLGKLVEIVNSRDIVKRPLHPYTQSLMSAVPIPDPIVSRARQRHELMGEIPSPLSPPPGCSFHTRCRYAKPVCSQEAPKLIEAAPGHYCACHLY